MIINKYGKYIGFINIKVEKLTSICNRIINEQENGEILYNNVIHKYYSDYSLKSFITFSPPPSKIFYYDEKLLYLARKLKYNMITFKTNDYYPLYYHDALFLNIKEKEMF